MDKKAPTPTLTSSLQINIDGMKHRRGVEQPIIGTWNFRHNFIPPKKTHIDYVNGSGNQWTGNGGIDEGQAATISNDQAVISVEQQRFLKDRLGHKWLQRIRDHQTNRTHAKPDAPGHRPTVQEKTANSGPVVLHGQEMVVSKDIAQYLEKHYPNLWNVGVPASERGESRSSGGGHGD